MANDDINLKGQIVTTDKQNSDFMKIVIINLASTVIVCIVFLIANFIIQTNLLNSKLVATDNQNAEEVQEGEDTEKPTHGIVVDLGDFILNLADEDQRRYLKTNVALEITEPATTEEAAPEAKKEGEGEGEGAAAPSATEKLLSEYKPAIRDAVITNLSSKTAVELSSVAGKELAKEQIMSAINGILAGQHEVLRVSFGQFIIQ